MALSLNGILEILESCVTLYRMLWLRLWKSWAFTAQVRQLYKYPLASAGIVLEPCRCEGLCFMDHRGTIFHQACLVSLFHWNLVSHGWVVNCCTWKSTLSSDYYLCRRQSYDQNLQASKTSRAFSENVRT